MWVVVYGDGTASTRDRAEEPPWNAGATPAVSTVSSPVHNFPLTGRDE
jgi:hypothetical protein